TGPRLFGENSAKTIKRVVLPHPLWPTDVKNSPPPTSRSTPSGATTRSLVKGLTYSCPSPRIVIFAVTSSARRLQIGKELRVRLHHFLDEPELEALLPRDRGLQLFLLEENLDVLVPGRNRVRRDACVEHHLGERLLGDAC